MPQLIIEQPGIPPMTVPMDSDELTFGRSEESDIVLVAEEVSRNHAKICRRGDRMVVLDLKSLNGTYVNRQRIVERVLSHQDEIWFGSKCRVVFRDDTNFGKRSPQLEPRDTESAMLRSVDKIRAEMERVGNNMTMIGRPASGAAAVQQTLAGVAPEQDLVQMGRAYRRLAALYEVSKIMASGFDLDERLSQVLDLILRELEADRGFVMLKEQNGEQLNVRLARQMGQDLEASSPSMGIAGRAAIDGEPVLMTDSATDQEFGMRDSIIQNKIRSAMCVPLQMRDEIFGSIYIDTQKFHVAFGDADLELFASLASQAAMAIHNVQLHEQVVNAEKRRQDFSRFLSPDLVERIMTTNTSLELGGQKTEATTIFCDIRGFTNISERSAPQEIVAMLNEHFTAVTEIIFHYQGTINKFIGDEVMAVFGAPFSTGDEPFQAVCAAIAIQNKNEELNELRKREGRPAIHLGIGIESGEVSAGYIGSPMRMEYTVIGDKVNTASRLCGQAKGGQIIVGKETWDRVKDRVTGQHSGAVPLKGKEHPVEIYEVTGLQ
ncbi:MAG: FHA domain-containing protein [Candidatus Hydrogenedens sp.]|nr:FHA domain-containing protein [Candidatus Hydrogenedens sp.]